MGKMDDRFVYEWKESERRPRPGPRFLLEAIFLAAAVACASVLASYVPGQDPSLLWIQTAVTAVATAVIVAASIAYYVMGQPGKEQSELVMKGKDILITRHVTSESGRKYIVTWATMDPRSIAVRRDKGILRIESVWTVTACRRKDRDKPTDSSVRDYPQTLYLVPERFKEAVSYMDRHGMELRDMTDKEYNDSLPFLSKHYWDN